MCHRPVFLRQQSGGLSQEFKAKPQRRAGDHRSEPDLSGSRTVKCRTSGTGIYLAGYRTHESLVEATNFVKTMEDHQHRKIACLEEIAYLNGWITKDDVMKVYEILKKNQYGQYLKDVLDGKYLDSLH